MVTSLISGESDMDEQDKAGSRVGWIGMLVFAAGWVLNQRKPMPAPPMAPQNTANSPAPATWAIPR